MTNSGAMRAWLGCLAALSVIAIGVNARATVLMQMSIEELTAASDLVVIADVQEQWVVWDEEAARMHTYTRVLLREVVTPVEAPEAVGDTLVIEQEGGFTEDFGVRVAGNASLDPGERVLLFLRRGEVYYIHGMEQGKYRIEVGDDEIERVIRPATVPVAVQRIEGTPLSIEEPTAPMSGQPLSVMRSRIVGGAP